MLGSIRKFSTSIYAKILLGIVVIPFIFWGMGSTFTSGNKNVVVVIDKEKYSTQEFINFVQSQQNQNERINSDQIEYLLSAFIGNKLIENEYEYFNIKFSDKSLSKLIKIQEEFIKDNKFSRTQYEKFLITNNIDAVTFEKNLVNQEKRKQLLNFIGGGIFPPKFIVNNIYDQINQKRKIKLINLNDMFLKKIKINENEIKKYFKKNKSSYSVIFKSAKLLEINPKQLVGIDEFNDLFFKRLDEIHDSIIQGSKIENIIEKYNLGKPDTLRINKLGYDSSNKLIDNIPKDVVKSIFSLTEDQPTSFLDIEDKFYIIEIFKTENIQKELSDINVYENVKDQLIILEKRKIISEMMSKINQNNFKKSDFDKLSLSENVAIQDILLEGLKDNKILKEPIVNKIYSFPEKKIFLANNIELTETFLIYTDKILHASIDVDSDEYKKYFNLSKISASNVLFNTYDNYIKNKYEIDINYNALKIVKNYFN
tara:strand:- start:1819 stop:3267 length:1449 start_codon:yes stop_codon:yes gene_type:complete